MFAGQESAEELRKLAYPGTDIYLLGYSCGSSASLQNVKDKWWPEVLQDCTGDPWVVLVGTKVKQSCTALQFHDC